MHAPFPSSRGGRYPAALNADLHCHSTVSDGTLAPEALAALAAANGVGLWSLTDHDELGGQARARAAASAHGLAYVTGVEVSVTWSGETIHIVGLDVDADHAVLVDGLARTRAGRVERAHEIARQLAAVGIDGAFDGALRHVGNPELISRTHFARFLVAIGVCTHTRDVFANYLTEGKPGYVAHRWAQLDEAVGWIRAAGGIAVLAHPGRYSRLSPLQHDALLDAFCDAGGTGIEVVTGSHTTAEYAVYARIAQRWGLLASRGSDYHGPEDAGVEPGRLPPLPAPLTPVWTRFR